MAGKSREVLEKEKEKALRAKAKLEEEKRAKEEAALLKPAQTQKVPFGVDPKTILCAFYKAGNCEKGNKCKFSHDMNVGRKVEKKNLYEDSREEKLAGMFAASFPMFSAKISATRYDGHLGRREATLCCSIKGREPPDYHRCASRLDQSISPHPK